MTAEQDQVDALMQRIHAANRMDRTCTASASTYALGYLGQYAAGDDHRPDLLVLLRQAVEAAEKFVQDQELARARRQQERNRT